MSRRSQRWALLAVVLVALAAGASALLHDAGGDPATSVRFHSRPDLHPDVLRVVHRARGTAPGFVFLAVKRGPGQDGPMIVDDGGRVVWFHPVPKGMTATLFQVQRYRGEPVLTWWQGHTHAGHGLGEYVIVDRHYREIARVRAAEGHRGDHHEFQLTPRGTALFTVYAPRWKDLSSVGGPRHGRIYESMIQEVDVASGRLVWAWHSADHLPPREGCTPLRAGRPHDYVHLNSIDVERGGRLLVSARNTHAIYEIDHRTGRILWRLGGRRSDFRMGPGARFALQHDARRRADGTISLFDNEATPRVGPQSRGLVLRLDRRHRTARLVRAYTHPDRLLAIAEGNVQTLPDGHGRPGHVFIGWGPQEHVSEFSRGGRLLFDLRLPAGSDTYQAFRFRWHGEPLDRPALAARRAGAGRVTVWASWNGATEVRRWEVLAGEDRASLAPVRSAAKQGFETAIQVRTDAPLVAVRALDARGRVLAVSTARSP
jgi:Arylsulfotransferase (ASST)